MDPRRLNRTASSCRVGDWAVGGVQVVYAGAEGLPAKRVEDCLQSEDLTTMAHMEGSNPLAPTTFLEKRAKFSLLDHSVPSEWSFPQIALGAGIPAQKRCYGPRIVRLLLG